MALIDIKNLSFSYPLEKQKVLDNISFSIEEGDFIVLCGSTGCGKSTLLRQLKKDLAPHGEKEGNIFYGGRNIDNLDHYESSSQIGFVMQNPDNQIVTDKVWHELAFGLENLGVKPSIIRRKVAEMANFFGIEQWFRKKTTSLSGGQKQLLNLASTMVMDPSFLILDEPTSQLDPIAAREFIDILSKINKELSLTILLVEHRLEEVFPIADKVAVLDKGKLLFFDTPQRVSKLLGSQYEEHPIKWALPTPVKIYNALDSGEDSPLTIREGRNWLTKSYKEKDNPPLSKIIPRIEPVHSFVNIKDKKESILELKDIFFRYEKKLPDVLENISLKVYKNEILSILGGNGSGKTTLLGILSGILKPYRGKVFLHGKNIRVYGDNVLYHHNIAMLPQDPQTLFVKNKVEKEFNEIVKTMKYTKAEAENKIKKIVFQLNIEKLLYKHPYDLSGGEQQKVALAKILLLEPKIILLDEPTKGIDAYAKKELGKILMDLKAEGVTIIIVSHDIEFSAQYSDQCALVFDRDIVSREDTVSFFSGNNFYTTAANRMARHIFPDAITYKDVIKRCKKKQKKVI